MPSLARPGPRVAVVTGGASGIGRAIAERLAGGGVRVVVVDRDSAGADVAEHVGGVFITANLVDPSAPGRIIAEAVERAGPISILVNSAGFQHVAPIGDFPDDRWREMIEVMLTAPFLLTKHAWPGMVEVGWGRIVNIASVHALVASPHKAAYVAAKHGLLGLTRVAALEGGVVGITANAICPAYVRTPLVEDQIADLAAVHRIPADQVVERVMLEPAAIKRLIEPAEVAALVAYLCSDAGAAITGAALPIDLGWTAR